MYISQSVRAADQGVRRGRGGGSVITMTHNISLKTNALQNTAVLLFCLYEMSCLYSHIRKLTS